MAIKLRVISDQHRELGEQRSARVRRERWQHRARTGQRLDPAGRQADRVRPPLRDRVSQRRLLDQGHQHQRRVHQRRRGRRRRESGPVELADGDRLRVGDYEIVVSVDKRTDFLPSAGEEAAAASNVDSGIGAKLDLGNLLQLARCGAVRIDLGAQCVRHQGARARCDRSRTPPRSTTSSHRRLRACRRTPTGR